MATEREVVELLESLVVALKPFNIVETGTYHGHGTMHLARGCHKNGFGHVHSAEPNAEFLQVAQTRLYGYGLDGVVTLHQITGEQLIRKIGRLGQIHFAFLDSNLDTRARELQTLMGFNGNILLSEGGVVAVHDTSTFHDKPGHDGPRTPMAVLARQCNLQILNLDTPRGLTLLRRKPKDI